MSPPLTFIASLIWLIQVSWCTVIESTLAVVSSAIRLSTELNSEKKRYLSHLVAFRHGFVLLKLFLACQIIRNFDFSIIMFFFFYNPSIRWLLFVWGFFAVKDLKKNSWMGYVSSTSERRVILPSDLSLTFLSIKIILFLSFERRDAESHFKVDWQFFKKSKDTTRLTSKETRAATYNWIPRLIAIKSNQNLFILWFVFD